MTDYASHKTRLIEKRQELQGRLRLTEATEKREVEEGSNDNAQLWEVSEIRDALDDEAAAELEQVDRALERIDAGDYGICESCAKPISRERLDAVPYAALCINCAGNE